MQPETFPLKTDSSGTIRVADSRVTLDTLIHSFKDGATAEDIAMRYPAIMLADVYAVITYYLRHQSEVESYLEKRQEHAEIVKQEIEQQFDSKGIRERLLARQP